MKKGLIILVIILLFGTVFTWFTMTYIATDTYFVISKNLGVMISRDSISQQEGGRNGEGMITVRTLYKTKDARLSIICSDDNYLVFIDICNKDYLISGQVSRLHYIPVGNLEKARNITLQFVVGHFNGLVVGDEDNETTDYLVNKNISIPPTVGKPYIDPVALEKDCSAKHGVVRMYLNGPVCELDSAISTSTWKTYTSTRSDYSFAYPPILSVEQNYTQSILAHSIPFKHPDPCDFKGDAPPLETLTDFRVSLEVINLSAKSIAQSTAYPGWEYVSKNPFTLGDLRGYKVQLGVEGCGEILYLFTISPTKTLVAHRRLVTELDPIIGNYQTNLKLPGIIPPSQEEEYVKKIIASFTVTN